jgi:hypothetical protein
MCFSDLKIPSVHLNGTSKDVLLEQTLNAAESLRSAINALCAASPNARDYYVQGDGVFKIAQAQHEDRVRRLQTVFKELVFLHEEIFDR